MSHHIALGSSWLWPFLTLSLVLTILTVFWGLPVRYVVECPSIRIRIVWCFLMIRLGLWVLGRKTTEVNATSYHFMSRGPAVVMTSFCWCWTWLPGWDSVCQVFSSTQLLFSCLFYCPLWKEVTVCSSHVRSGELCSTFWSVECLHKPFEILQLGILVYFPSFTFEIIYLYQWL